MSTRGQEEDINDILQFYDSYIIRLVRKRIPRNIVPLEVMDLEIDDLAQITRCKLWLALQREYISNIKAYIHCIVYHEVINLIRRHRARPAQRLVIDEQGELREGRALIESGEGMKDPSDEIEQEETAQDYMLQLTKIVKSLPPRQQQAIICLLKERVDDLLPLIDAFMHYDINIETIDWPVEKREIHQLKASLSITRKKLEFLKQTRNSHEPETSSPSTQPLRQPPQKRQP
jgi:RNA polymerase sigma factor (sigma-70 family)